MMSLSLWLALPQQRTDSITGHNITRSEPLKGQILLIFAETFSAVEKLTEFVSAHLTDDISRLLLASGKWPEIDMDLAVNCIESRRKLKGKVQEWYEEPQLIFPRKLSAEQCSSSATAAYKASLAEKIADSAGKPWRLADLTGGLGVDSWFFSKRASEVLYNEMQSVLCEAAKHNFSVLEASNIRISNHAISPADTVGSDDLSVSPATLLSDFQPDIVFMDPARRGEGGKKVFLIEECTPDVLTLKDEIFSLCRHILIKLSPMADITMVCDRLGHTCREVHVVAYGGECKELLIWMDREWNDEYTVKAVELSNRYPQTEAAIFSFLPSEERQTSPSYSTGSGSKFLFEPGKGLMKAGAFNLISNRFSVAKLGKSTHYYTTENSETAEILKPFGKVYEIIRCEPLDKRTMKSAGKEFPRAEVTARNIPMDTDTLRKKLGVTSGDDAHIFGLKSDTAGNLLIITYVPKES